MFRKLKYAVLALLASTVFGVQSFAKDQFDSPDLPSMAGQIILICGGAQRTESSDGYELIFQVNYLSHALLTDLLLPLSKNSAPERIINLASGAQRPINFDDVMMVSY
jgi:NAD(P)-dependent dehydrogenase (short-subunit alcohol dehydrogenase family)